MLYSSNPDNWWSTFRFYILWLLTFHERAVLKTFRFLNDWSGNDLEVTLLFKTYNDILSYALKHIGFHCCAIQINLTSLAISLFSSIRKTVSNNLPLIKFSHVFRVQQWAVSFGKEIAALSARYSGAKLLQKVRAPVQIHADTHTYTCTLLECRMNTCMHRPKTAADSFTVTH